jgi:transcriptional regulator with XRE-family HTH domain
VSFTYVETKSGVTARTLHAWFQGKTKRPQHCTIAAVAACLGYEISFTARSAPNVVPIHKKAAR